MKVPNAKLREAYLSKVALGHTKPSTVAHRLGWLNPNSNRADTSRLRRTLGIIPDTTVRGQHRYRKHREFVSEELALEMCEALNLDPVEVGL